MKIEHLPTGKMSEMQVNGVFIFVGYLPNTEPLQDHIQLNDRGEIKALTKAMNNFESAVVM